MATSSSSRGSSLHGLLNSLEIANKQDCVDFSSGHLNENKLFKYAEKKSTRSWESAQKPQIALTPRSHLTKSSSDWRNGPMHDALLKFSIGTNGTIPVPPTGKKPVKSRSSVRVKPERKPSYLDDGILVEEFTPRDPVDDVKPSPRIEPSPRVSQDLIQSAITKRDQYIKRQVLEHDLIRKQDAREMNVLSGHKAVQHLESKLQHQLDQLDRRGPGANFYRLQIYRDIFDELIAESSALGPMLRTIKTEYDKYTDYLLDNNPTQHKLLQEQISQMADRKMTPLKELRDQKERLKNLEQEAENLLLENRRLREELEKENRGEFEPVQVTDNSQDVEQRLRISPRSHNISDKVESLRTNILGSLDEIQKIRSDLKQNYVPTSVVKQLEQCVKETEVENQNLTRKNQLIEEDIAVLMEKLAGEIKAADTSESDERRIWRRLLPKQTGGQTDTKSASSISSTRAVITPSMNTTSGSGSESESEDDTKWNWYIS